MEKDIQVVRFKSHDPVEHAEFLKPWDLQIGQVLPGRFEGSVDAVLTPSMILYDERWSPRCIARGSTPPGYVLIGALVVSDPGGSTWCSADLGPRSLATAPPAAEMCFRAPDCSRQAAILVRQEVLRQSLGEEWYDRFVDQRFLTSRAPVGSWVGGAIIQTVRRFTTRPKLLSQSYEVRSLESRLLDLLIRCTKTVAGPTVRGSPSRRSRAVEAALEFAATQRGRTTALALSSVAGVSQRTLEYAFSERLGTTPGRYLRTLRLNGVRRDLLASDPQGTQVWRVASAWGFHNHGRFSAQYRRQFAASPSHDLRESRRAKRASPSSLSAP